MISNPLNQLTECQDNLEKTKTTLKLRTNPVHATQVVNIECLDTKLTKFENLQQIEKVLHSAPENGYLQVSFKLDQNFGQGPREGFILEKKNVEPPAENIELWFNNHDEKLVFELNTDYNHFFLYSSRDHFIVGQWYQIKIKWGNELRLYIDNELEDFLEVKGFMAPGNKSELFIGKNRKNMKYFQGEIRNISLTIEEPIN
jgi:hypothetical protein